MKPEEYAAFTQALLQNLTGDPRVLGLVALGSMAERGQHPDQWSDHDFFVITHPHEQEAFRTDLGWLPDAGEVVLHLRETEHGVKAVYRSGHLVEFAVFDLVELRMAKINRYRVLLDRGGVRRAVEEVVVETLRWSERQYARDDYDLGEFLTNLLVGAGRFVRGERLSGRYFVKALALQHLLHLLGRHLLPERENRLDNLDPLRRFEQAFPPLGQELNAILEEDTGRCAILLLDLAERELRPRMSDFPAEAVEIIRSQLKAALRAGSKGVLPWS
jgi:hypothetical protein